MKKAIFLLLLVGINFQIFAQTKITGTIQGLSGKVASLYLILGENKRIKMIDSCKVYNDSFEFHVPDPEPKIYAAVAWNDFKTEPKAFVFWADTNNVVISGTINDIILDKNLDPQEAYLFNLCSALEIRGSVNQELMNDIIDINKEDLLDYFQIRDRVFLKKGKSPKKIIKEKILLRIEPFIANHSDKPCSAFILFWLGALEKVIDPKETRRLLNILTKENQHSYYAKLAYDLLSKS